MSRLWFLPFLLAVLFLVSAVYACEWDSDTLATEAKGLPDVVEVITGRFERNPPLYYEMRLARVTKEIGARPAKLDLYDDAAVASDRLHRSKEAIQWMAKKRAQLDKLGFNARSEEHWYRYHANLGTFLAHDWLRSGANRKNMAPMKQARDHIKRAIQINPDAHFGREKYQLKAMEWIIEPPPVQAGHVSFPDFLDLRERVGGNMNKQLRILGYPDAIGGLKGLIVLGDAWESVDVFHTFKLALAADQHNHLAHMANFRIIELIGNGKGSILPGSPAGEELKNTVGFNQGVASGLISPRHEKLPLIERYYDFRRAEAEQFQKRRADYMIERLQVGRHPDTDKTFWNDWRDTPPPSPEIMKSIWFQKPWLKPVMFFLATVFCFCLGLAIAQRRLHPKPAPSAS
jgi:hypothetical protein